MRHLITIALSVAVTAVALGAWEFQVNSAQVTGTPANDSTAYWRDSTEIFKINIGRQGKSLERLWGRFCVHAADSAESLYLVLETSADNATWNRWWADSTDSGSFTGVDSDTAIFIMPHYYDSVLYFYPWVKAELWTVLTVDNWDSTYSTITYSLFGDQE